MTSAELQQIRKWIEEAVGNAVTPLKEKLDDIEDETSSRQKRHSLRIGEVANEARRSKVEILQTTEGTILGAIQHVDGRMGALEERVGRIETATNERVVPAVNEAEFAAQRAVGEAKAIAVSTDRIERASDRLISWWRHPAFSATINAIVGAALSWFVAHGNGCGFG